MEERTIQRGDIYIADLNPIEGSEQGGFRPVLVIQNNLGNQHSPTIIVATLTTRKNAKLPTHVKLGNQFGLAQNSMVLAEQIRTLDKHRLTKYIGSIDLDATRKVNRALKISLGIIKNEPIEITLCPECANLFYKSQTFHLRRIDPYQMKKDVCEFCRTRRGYDYHLTKDASTKWKKVGI